MSAARPSTWMPLYVGDYLADTGHLSTRQHGAYFLLIMHYWRTGKPIPTRVQQVLNICRLSLEQWSEDGEAILGFFEETQDGYVHTRIEAELHKAVEFIEQKREAGKKSAAARAQRPLNTPSTGGVTEGQRKPNTSPSPSPNRKINVLSLAPPEPLNALQEEFEEFYQAYPNKKAKANAAKAFAGARRKATAEQILCGLENYKRTKPGYAEWAHPASWLNGERWLDQVAESPKRSVTPLGVGG